MDSWLRMWAVLCCIANFQVWGFAMRRRNGKNLLNSLQETAPGERNRLRKVTVSFGWCLQQWLANGRGLSSYKQVSLRWTSVLVSCIVRGIRCSRLIDSIILAVQHLLRLNFQSLNSHALEARNSICTLRSANQEHRPSNPLYLNEGSELAARIGCGY